MQFFNSQILLVVVDYGYALVSWLSVYALTATIELVKCKQLMMILTIIVSVVIINYSIAISIGWVAISWVRVS